MSSTVEMNIGRKIVQNGHHTDIPLTMVNPPESPQESVEEMGRVPCTRYIQECHREIQQCRLELQRLLADLALQEFEEDPMDPEATEATREFIRKAIREAIQEATGDTQRKLELAAQEAKQEISTQKKQTTETRRLQCLLFLGFFILVGIRMGPSNGTI
ncbi:hypothetical protein O988_02040 [Pseudogymnoascus sp. VKM F-3808]|nr:hypothetical protein O988_02040 [Pseudogymnoascus sp. VKM F-3808]